MEDHRKIKSLHDIESKEDKTEEVPMEPCRAMCEICRKEVTTYVKTEFNALVWVLLIFVLYFYGLFYGSPILLLTVPLFRNVTHSCPYCFELLLTKSFYPIQIKEKYCWLQYGKCVIILRQIYIFLFLILVLSFGFYINITQLFRPKEAAANYHDHSHEIDEKVKEHYTSSSLTWQDLIKDCGSYVMTENSARATEIFNRKYHKRIIEWKGYFLNAYVQGRNPLDFNPDHLMNINVRMIPSESMRNPDLFLSLDYRRYKELSGLIRTLSTGTPIKFKASLEALGNEWRSHHLHLISLEKTEDFIDHNQKVVLFQGINFNITGHIRNEKEIEQLSAQMEDVVEEKQSNNTTNVDKENKIEENKLNETNAEQTESNSS